jgi:Ca2+/Na+ antiporter
MIEGFVVALSAILSTADILVGALIGGVVALIAVGASCFVATWTITDRSLREEFWWGVHNLIAHPLSELLYWTIGERAANWLHDATVPKHKKGTGRG